MGQEEFINIAKHIADSAAEGDFKQLDALVDAILKSTSFADLSVEEVRLMASVALDLHRQGIIELGECSEMDDVIGALMVVYAMGVVRGSGSEVFVQKLDTFISQSNFRSN